MTKEQIEKAQALLLRHDFGELFLHIDVCELLQQIVADGAAAGYKTKVACMPGFNESKSRGTQREGWAESLAARFGLR